jgi:hypothetical protein
MKTRTKPGNPEARTNNCLGETLLKIKSWEEIMSEEIELISRLIKT